MKQMSSCLPKTLDSFFYIASRFGAAILFLEHRFYGQSLPFANISGVNDTKKLGYLTSTQALADFATLIVDFKKNLSCSLAPVVAFGGSYGGMLAAWFRLKYPHIAIGALASSAPLLDFEGILENPNSYYDIVSVDFKRESNDCFEVIKGSWNLIEEVASKPGGLELLREEFKICNKSMQVDDLENWLLDAWVYSSMGDYPFATNFFNPMPARPVKEMCKRIDESKTKDSFVKLRRAASVYYNYSGQSGYCFDVHNGSSSLATTRLWPWQVCTEMIITPFGMSEKSMFPAFKWDFEIFAQLCESEYGIKPRKNWAITEYGGYDFKRVLKRFGSNIIFSNGKRDPWSGGGVLKNISHSIVAIVAAEGAHHVDLFHPRAEDPQWLKSMRQSEIEIIQEWLKVYNTDHFMQK